MYNKRQFPFGQGIGIPGIGGIGAGEQPGGFGGPGGAPLSAAQQQQIIQQAPRPTSQPPQHLISLFYQLSALPPQQLSSLVQQQPQGVSQLYQMVGMQPPRYYDSGNERQSIWFCQGRWTLVFSVSFFGGVSVSLAWIAIVNPLFTLGFCYPAFNPCFFSTQQILLALC